MEVAQRRPKRVGGAPFAAATHWRRAVLERSFQDPQGAAASSKRGNSSARVTAHLAHEDAHPRRTVSARSCDGAGASSDKDPVLSKAISSAHRYVDRLAGLTAEARGALEWPLLDEMTHMEHVNAERARNQALSAREKQNRTELHRQQQGRQEEAVRERESMKLYRQEAEAQAAQYLQEEENKKRQVLAAQRQVNLDRDAELAANRRRKQVELEAERAKERQIIREMLETQRREELAEEEALRGRKQEFIRVLEHASTMERAKQERKKEENKEDVEMLQLRIRIMEEEDRKRHEAIHTKKQEQLRHMRRYEQKVAAEAAHQAQSDEDRARREADAAYQRQQAEATKREQRLQRMRQANRAAIQEQLAQHEADRKRVREADQQMAEQLGASARAAILESEEAERRRKQALTSYAEALRQQIADKEKSAREAVGRDQMSEAERKINQAQLQRALRPEGLQQLVKKKQKEYELAWQAVDGVAAVM